MQARNKIPYMFDKNKVKICDPQGIVDLFADYCQNLYNIHESEPSHSPSAEKINAFLGKLSLPLLSSHQLDELNCPVTLQEVKKVILSSKLLKSPGPDGPPNEYYCTFVDILAPHLQNVCQSFFYILSPPAEMLQATISTIPKPGKPLDNPANFRPISLLNSDIEIILQNSSQQSKFSPSFTNCP